MGSFSPRFRPPVRVRVSTVQQIGNGAGGAVAAADTARVALLACLGGSSRVAIAMTTGFLGMLTARSACA
jgi:hypothetical protein